MRKLKVWFVAVAAAAALVIGSTGCGQKAPGETAAVTEGGGAQSQSSLAETSQAGTKAGTGDAGAVKASSAGKEMRKFTDSAGREVEIPVNIQKIAPSGPLAQIVLYTACPDKLAGLASDFSPEAKQYIDKKYWGLPKFGQFYGKNASLNMEALIAASPDVIIDIGEAKKTEKEDMDALQKQLGIPVVFIEATLPTLEKAYVTLGDLTGEKDQADKLAAYCKQVLSHAGKAAASIPDDKRKSVYFAVGDDGLHTNAKGSIHADVIDKVGAVNAADVEVMSKGGGSQVSFEQVLLWKPDVIIADSQKLYDKITTDPMWKTLNAVKEGHVYKIPTAPYSFMGSPPSVNRIIGIQWLGSLLYPDQYPGDIRAQIKEFYQLFYHIQVTDQEMDEILKNALS